MGIIEMMSLKAGLREEKGTGKDDNNKPITGRLAVVNKVNKQKIYSHSQYWTKLTTLSK